MALRKVGFRGSSAGKESACNTGDPGSIPGSGSSPGEGADRDSCILEKLLKEFMERTSQAQKRKL